jgi:plastocyanin
MKQILMAAATMVLIDGAAAHDDENPATASQAPSAKHQRDKSAPHSHSPAEADQSQGATVGALGRSAEAKRTIKVDMTDAMRFNPSSIKVKKGETVRFVVTNSGLHYLRATL